MANVIATKTQNINFNGFVNLVKPGDKSTEVLVGTGKYKDKDGNEQFYDSMVIRLKNGGKIATPANGDRVAVEAKQVIEVVEKDGKTYLNTTVFPFSIKPFAGNSNAGNDGGDI